ncbi:hypothetical protein [Okeania sp. KiyG1]|nr:hypothetical protein [Okeania sp. KiyG1]
MIIYSRRKKEEGRRKKVDIPLFLLRSALKQTFDRSRVAMAVGIDE